MNIYYTPKGTNYLFDLYKKFIKQERNRKNILRKTIKQILSDKF